MSMLPSGIRTRLWVGVGLLLLACSSRQPPRAIDAGAGDDATPDGAESDSPATDAAAPDRAARCAVGGGLDRSSGRPRLRAVSGRGCDDHHRHGATRSRCGRAVPTGLRFPRRLAIMAHTPLFAEPSGLHGPHPEVGKVKYIDLDGDRLADLVIDRAPQSVSTCRGRQASYFHPGHRSGGWGQRQPAGGCGSEPQRPGRRGDVPPAQGGSATVSELAVFFQASDGFHDTPDQHIVVGPQTGVPCASTYALLVDDMNRDGFRSGGLDPAATRGNRHLLGLCIRRWKRPGVSAGT